MADHRSQEERIRRVYAEREARGLAERYAEDRPDVRLRRRSWRRALAWGLGAWGGDVGRARMLDLGCGNGEWLAALADLGAEPARLVGLELLCDRARGARANLSTAVGVLVGSGYRLPLADGACDVVVASTVLSSLIDDDARAALAAEMVRILAPGGAALIYDFRYPNPANPEVRAVTAGDVRRAFPGRRLRRHSTTLAPPLARRIAPLSAALAGAIERAFPPARSHVLYVVTGPGS